MSRGVSFFTLRGTFLSSTMGVLLRTSTASAQAESTLVRLPVIAPAVLGLVLSFPLLRAAFRAWIRPDAREARRTLQTWLLIHLGLVSVNSAGLIFVDRSYLSKMDWQTLEGHWLLVGVAGLVYAVNWRNC